MLGRVCTKGPEEFEAAGPEVCAGPEARGSASAKAAQNGRIKARMGTMMPAIQLSLPASDAMRFLGMRRLAAALCNYCTISATLSLGTVNSVKCASAVMVAPIHLSEGPPSALAQESGNPRPAMTARASRSSCATLL